MGNRAEVKLRVNSKGNRFRRTSRKRPDRSLRSPYGVNAPFISAADDIEARLDPFASYRRTAAICVRREKAALSSGCKSHPANAPAGSNRSSHGGNEMAEAFGVAGHI